MFLPWPPIQHSQPWIGMPEYLFPTPSLRSLFLGLCFDCGVVTTPPSIGTLGSLILRLSPPNHRRRLQNPSPIPSHPRRTRPLLLPRHRPPQNHKIPPLPPHRRPRHPFPSLQRNKPTLQIRKL